MLGWEFPPAISGGLGVACYGLCKALSRTCDIHLILPRVDPEIVLPGVNIINLSTLEIKEYFTKKELLSLTKVIKEEKVNFNISPYPSTAGKIISEKTIQVEKELSIDIPQIKKGLQEDDLYGLNTYEKIVYYSDIVIKVAEQIEFDVIHAHDWITFQAGIKLKEKFQKPFIIHIHSLNYDRLGPEEKGKVYEIERNAMRLADRIIAVSNYTASIIVDHYKIKRNKIVVVHNGIDPVKPFKTGKNFPEKLVLFMGRITLQKGPEYFLETAYKVLQKYSNVRFAIAGTGDKLKQMLEDGNFSEVGNKLHFTGFLERPEVHSLLSMTDVYCMPSLSEPFGLTAVEAVQFGIPVVITNRSGAAEVLSSALTADFWDTEKMSEMIVKLLTNENYYDSVVRRGQKDLKKITWSKSAQQVVSLYREL